MNIIAELLLSYIDLTVLAIEVFDPYKTYGKPINEYKRWRKDQHITSQNISHLKNNGYIQKDNNKYVVTNKGNASITRYLVKNLKIETPDKWDCIWRVIVFDIPEAERAKRDTFRRKLEALGLLMVQKSVFCHPYECVREVTFLTKVLQIEKYVTYMEVSNIVTGKNIFKHFKIT